MGKTRDLFKKIRDTMGTFHAKMGSIKPKGKKKERLEQKIKSGGISIFSLPLDQGQSRCFSQNIK